MIDAAHREILFTVSTLVQLAEDDSPAFSSCLGKLQAMMVAHVAEEERLLSSMLGEDSQESHRLEHGNLLRLLHDAMAYCEARTLSVSRKISLSRLIERWILQEISQHDQLAFSLLRRQG